MVKLLPVLEVVAIISSLHLLLGQNIYTTEYLEMGNHKKNVSHAPFPSYVVSI